MGVRVRVRELVRWLPLSPLVQVDVGLRGNSPSAAVSSFFFLLLFLLLLVRSGEPTLADCLAKTPVSVACTFLRGIARETNVTETSKKNHFLLVYSSY
jgi:hypothetical protein